MNDSGNNLDEQFGSQSDGDDLSLIAALDRKGASERSTLSSAVLERIVAASEFQLPLGASAATPGAPRLQLIAPQRSFVRRHASLVRYAAAAAIVLAAGGLIFMLSRDAGLIERAGHRELAVDPTIETPTDRSAPTDPIHIERIVLQPPTVEHLESAMVAMSSAPLALPNVLHSSLENDWDAQVDADLSAYHDVSFAELSSEFAAIVTQSAYRP